MARGPKKRLDLLTVASGLAPSRERAKALIMAGRIMVDGVTVSKPGTSIPVSACITRRGEDLPFVSRGGLKLQAALDAFKPPLDGAVCIDVGASTGGFTDCLIQNGAARVYAVDVGYGQLAWKLRQDPRVISMERTNARYLTPEAFTEPVDLATIDAAFISLKLVVPAVVPCLKAGAAIIALIKPQFEVGRGQVGKGGVVHDPRLHAQVTEELQAFFRTLGLAILGLCPSPIHGPKGNREFLVYLQTPRPDRRRART
jgi:23S rRNA (cytidine1920-2'-O)/16S rRNA (cytidine1409-2'-O)-methyltransferase